MRVFLSSLRCFFLAIALAALLDDRPHETTLLRPADDGYANPLAR